MSDKINRSVERVSASYAYTKAVLGSGTHACKWDPQGRCFYCSNRAELQGRTGELSQGVR